MKNGKIVDGMMMPDPIDGSYIEIDAKKIFSFIEVFKNRKRY